jgi:hypothetical protein
MRGGCEALGVFFIFYSCGWFAVYCCRGCRVCTFSFESLSGLNRAAPGHSFYGILW